MSAFKRGLSDDFVRKLNELYGREGSWWKEMVDDPDTFVAIRDNYVNVYYRGASLARIELSGNEVVASVHYKYLLNPSRADEYVQFGEDGAIDWGPLDRTSFLTDPIEVAALKAASRPYTGEEKEGVHKIVVNPDNAVVDVEIAISDGSRVPRIDIAALVDVGDVVQVRFFEAKAFSNGELRAAGDNAPSVVQQIETYRRLLGKSRNEVVCSYRNVCENFVNLEGLLGSSTPRDSLVNAVVEGKPPLELDDEPRLVVFGFDQDQKNGKWRRELRKLQGHSLEVIARGDANVRLS